MKFNPESPEGKIEKRVAIRQRPNGWVIMDASGLHFLKQDGKAATVPDYWQSRSQAREFYTTWRGGPAPRGQRSKGAESTELTHNRNGIFKRQLLGLFFLWETYPGGATIETVKRQVDPQIGTLEHPRTYRRDLDALVQIGFAIREGSMYTAVPNRARWYSADFDKLEDVPCNVRNAVQTGSS